MGGEWDLEEGGGETPSRPAMRPSSVAGPVQVGRGDQLWGACSDAQQAVLRNRGVPA